MSAVSVKKPGVEVCIWLPRDRDGNYTDALDGAIREGKRDGISRVGHASLKIYPSAEDQKTYASLMVPGKDHVYASLWPEPHGFRKAYEDDLATKNGEGEPPNAIVRLNNLNIPNMLAAMKKNVEGTNWTLVATAGSSSEHSCSSLVLRLLGDGGLDTKSGYEGPHNQDLYRKTNCHLGDIVNGAFNGAAWRGWAVSPKLVLHIAAAAAETDPSSRQDTIALMESSLVHRDSQIRTVTVISNPTPPNPPVLKGCGLKPCQCPITDPFFAFVVQEFNSKIPRNPSDKPS